MTKIIVHGLGRLGLSICTDAPEVIAAGIDVAPPSGLSFPVFADVLSCKVPADVIIDCSTASAVDGIIGHAVRKDIPLVICTTGLDNGILDKINDAANYIPIFLSANMSLGVGIAARLAATAATALKGFDIEIIEKHHNQKLDAPSGTANLLADAIMAATGQKPQKHGRTGMEKRGEGEIGFHSIRGGTIVGEHSVIFAGPDEIIEIKHSALSRRVFARGAITAANLIAAKDPGLYNWSVL